MTTKRVLSVGQLLKGVFYTKFLPKCAINEFSVPGWKIAILNHAPNTVLLRRLSDDHHEPVTEKEMQKNFLLEQDYINLVRSNGYQLLKKENHLLYFIPSK